MMAGRIKVGAVVGTGSALTIELGFIPDYFMCLTMSGTMERHEFFRGKHMVFTSGGTTEIKKGDKVTGATSGAVGYVEQVLLTSGTWAGGDAAGTFLLYDETQVGTFTSENVYVAGGTNDAGVVVPVQYTASIDTELAAVTGNDAITAYVGTTTASKGVTLGSTISVDNVTLRYIAIGND